MNTPTDTPKTDAECGAPDDATWPGAYVSADFARTLERRVIAAEARVKELEEQCAILQSQVDNADINLEQAKLCARAALRLRPIAKAGPVPDGAVRLWVFYTGGNWVFKPWKDNADTHFIDIYPPQ